MMAVLAGYRTGRSKIPVVDKALDLLVQVARNNKPSSEDDAAMLSIADEVDNADAQVDNADEVDKAVTLTRRRDPRQALLIIKTRLKVVVQIEYSQVSAQCGRASWWGAGGQGPPGAS